MLFSVLLIACMVKNVDSFVLPASYEELNNKSDPYAKYIKAVLHTSGYIPYERDYIESYMGEIYDGEFTPYKTPTTAPTVNVVSNVNVSETQEINCQCKGCLVNGECISCLSERVCKRAMGVYC